MKATLKITAAILVVASLAFGGGYYFGQERKSRGWRPEVLVAMTSENLNTAINALEAARAGDTGMCIEELRKQNLMLVMNLDLMVSTAPPLGFGFAQKAFYPLYRLAQDPQLLPARELHSETRWDIHARLPLLLRGIENQRNEALLRDLKTNNLTPQQVDAVYKDALRKLIPQPTVGGDGQPAPQP